MQKKLIIAAALVGAGFAAQAADIDVTANIVTSTSWTSNNVYHLRDLIYVEPGATLSIQEGTRIVGYDPDMLSDFWGEPREDCAALIITRGAKIMANGSRFAPIVFTSGYDDGTYRVSDTEWGNLTILGNAIIADGTVNTTQNGTQFDYMEGLVPNELSKYGGTDDDDSSGVVRFVSLRYGGSVLGDADELNGLSMGGVGRGTVMEYIDIFNNTDDGIEIWGGTANMKYLSIWNIGDDSLDLDEGYRGKIQFGLIVAGYGNVAGSVGSGVGDRLFEMDGGENPTTMQPYASPQLYNWTAIGQPNHVGGGRGLSFRDNMRLQVGNSIFMDVGAELVHFGNGNVAEMVDAWSTPHDVYDSTGVDFSTLPYTTMADFYSSSRSGNWSWVKDSVMYNIKDNVNIGVSGKTVADIGLYDAANHNVVASQMPIVSITRDTTPGQPAGMQLVVGLDPRAANDAVSSVTTPPADGFFTPVTYRGAFSPNYNWLEGWTAAYEYGLTDVSANSSAPVSSIAFGALVSFLSENGVVYGVERAADVGGPYTEVATIVGDGTTKTYVDDAVSTAGFYRVVVK